MLFCFKNKVMMIIIRIVTIIVVIIIKVLGITTIIYFSE